MSFSLGLSFGMLRNRPLIHFVQDILARAEVRIPLGSLPYHILGLSSLILQLEQDIQGLIPDVVSYLWRAIYGPVLYEPELPHLSLQFRDDLFGALLPNTRQ